MSHDPEEFLSVNEAAQLLGVSATTVRNWASDGRLEELRTAGGHRRFRAAEVRELAREVLPTTRPTVLVVDDDESIRYVIREAFQSVGFAVVEAGSGLLGLDSLDEQAPSVVLLDIMMPGIDGLQVMKYLDQFGVRIPVVVMSALGARVEERARQLGANAFLAKPFDIRELVVTCRRVIEEQRQRDASERS